MPLSQQINTHAGDREVHIATRQESAFPHLSRLCTDFNFQVMQSPAEGCDSFRLTIQEQNQERQITPAFSQLELLESHVCNHLVDILHNYVFDAPAAH